MYGYFSGRRFAVVLASSDKKAQKRCIKLAKRLRKQYDIAAPELEDYDV